MQNAVRLSSGSVREAFRKGPRRERALWEWRPRFFFFFFFGGGGGGCPDGGGRWELDGRDTSANWVLILLISNIADTPCKHYNGCDVHTSPRCTLCVFAFGIVGPTRLPSLS